MRDLSGAGGEAREPGALPCIELTLYFRDIRGSARLDTPRQHTRVGTHPLLWPPPGVIWEGGRFSAAPDLCPAGSTIRFAKDWRAICWSVMA